MRLKVFALALLLFGMFSASAFADEGKRFEFTFSSLPGSVENAGKIVGGSVEVLNKGIEEDLIFYVSDLRPTEDGSLGVYPKDSEESLMESTWVSGFEGEGSIRPNESKSFSVSVAYPTTLVRTHPVAFVVANTDGEPLQFEIVDLVDVPLTDLSVVVITESASFVDEENKIDVQLNSVSDRVVEGTLKVRVESEDGKEYTAIKHLQGIHTYSPVNIPITFSEPIPAGTYTIYTDFISGDNQLSFNFLGSTTGIDGISEDGQVIKEKKNYYLFGTIILFLIVVALWFLFIRRRVTSGKKKVKG